MTTSISREKGRKESLVKTKLVQEKRGSKIGLHLNREQKGIDVVFQNPRRIEILLLTEERGKESRLSDRHM